MNRLSNILGSRAAGIICFLFAIANRVVFTSLYSFVGADTKLQLAYAKNFLAGKGMGVTKYFTTDLNNPVFDTQQIFPPGFSFTIIPFLKLTGGDENMAVFIFDIVVAILFVIAVRLVGKKAGLSPVLNNIVTLFAGCAQYLFFTSWSSTDAVAVCLLLFAMNATVTLLKNKQELGLLKIAGYCLLFFLPFFFRFMYLPATLFFPTLIFLYGFVLKNNGLKKTGIKTIALSIIFLVAFFLVSQNGAGNSLYYMSSERGLYLDQIALCYPFFPAAFINIDFGAQLLQKIFGFPYGEVINYLSFFNAAFFLFSVILFWRFIRIQKRSLFFQAHTHFIIIGSLFSFIILFLLAYLSVTYKVLTWGFYKWVAVVEARYFAFIYAFIPLLFFICLHHYRHSFRKPLIRFFAFALLICMATEILHGVYYNVKILSSHKDLAYIRDADKGFRNFPAILTVVKNENPGKEILVSSPDKYYLTTAIQLGFKAVFDFDNFIKNGLHVNKKTIVVIPIQTQDVSIISDYMEKNKPVLIATQAQTSFYVQEINPH
jgi:hypothetical protein